MTFLALLLVVPGAMLEAALAVWFPRSRLMRPFLSVFRHAFLLMIASACYVSGDDTGVALAMAIVGLAVGSAAFVYGSLVALKMLQRVTIVRAWTHGASQYIPPEPHESDERVH